ncbi:UNVERIFIED_CONTAM: hypothetical protein FKN15_065340 [Acipenser sinensis]
MSTDDCSGLAMEGVFEDDAMYNIMEEEYDCKKDPDPEENLFYEQVEFNNDPGSLFFNDGERRIDFVLVYEDEDTKDFEKRHQFQRRKVEFNNDPGSLFFNDGERRIDFVLVYEDEDTKDFEKRHQFQRRKCRFNVKSEDQKCPNERYLLYREWAHPRSFYKLQPLDLIRKYYGEKVGIYFAWLAFYTKMLAFAAVVGLGCFIFGYQTKEASTWSKEVCDPQIGGSIIMCPQCDRECTYWRLNSTCESSKKLCIFDNFGTLVFAVFMAVWVTLFLEFWKRYQAELEYEWDTATFLEQEEQPRPEYEAKCIHKRVNPVTQVLLIIASVVGVIVYRLAVFFAFSAHLSNLKELEPFREYVTPQMATSVTASIISFVIIMILNTVYEKVAIWITDFELPRTKTDYENSLTLKMFLFQFVNYYSSCFYIAFFKGKIVGYPGDPVYWLGKYRNEEVEFNNDPGSLFFNDGERRIDFVLVYEDEDTKDFEKRHQFQRRKRQRQYFEESLMNMGLELEATKSVLNEKVVFVKGHTPWEVLCTYAEVMHIKMPIQLNDLKSKTSAFNCFTKLFSPSEDLIHPKTEYFTAPFEKERISQFYIKDREQFFTPSMRSRICRFNVKSEDQKCPNERYLLYREWAHPRSFYKLQPLDLIRKYYGEKKLCIFDNFSTLVFAVFMAVWVTLFLEFWKRYQAELEYEWDTATFLEQEEQPRPEYEAKCIHKRVNPVTQFWKRYQAELEYEWDTATFLEQEEQPRPEYEAKCIHKRVNPVTQVLLIIASVVGVIVYRLAVFFAFSAHLSNLKELEPFREYVTPQMATSVTASIISFVIIMILNTVYEKVAIWITDFELPGTKTDYENNLTLKMFLFQFVNYYSSCFYIAFFKGKIVGYPGDPVYWLGKYRNEEVCCTANKAIKETDGSFGIRIDYIKQL